MLNIHPCILILTFFCLSHQYILAKSAGEKKYKSPGGDPGPVRSSKWVNLASLQELATARGYTQNTEWLI